MATYKNPAAAVGHCERKGLCSPGELYACALGQMPRSAPESWAKNARRLVNDVTSKGLCGARTQRKAKKAKKRAQSKRVRKTKW